jgi:hypothetical protein
MKPNLHDYMEPSEWVEWAKEELNIAKPNTDMDEDEIKQVIRLLGTYTIDSVFTIDGEFRITRDGINLMLLIVMMEFPWHYEKYELSHQN